MDEFKLVELGLEPGQVGVGRIGSELDKKLGRLGQKAGFKLGNQFKKMVENLV